MLKVLLYWFFKKNPLFYLDSPYVFTSVHRISERNMHSNTYIQLVFQILPHQPTFRHIWPNLVASTCNRLLYEYKGFSNKKSNHIESSTVLVLIGVKMLVSFCNKSPFIFIWRVSTKLLGYKVSNLSCCRSLQPADYITKSIILVTIYF